MMGLGNIRQAIFETITEQQKAEYSLQGPTVLSAVARKLGASSNEQQQAVLAIWHDLMYRDGLLAWGVDMSNASEPWFHVTDRGRSVLQQLSRDPSNPDGYLASLDKKVSLDPVARSYLVEALHSYNNTCFKAAAVMVGGAAERLTLGLRDVFTTRLTTTGKSVPAALTDWRIKTVRDALTKEFDGHKKDMPKELSESFGAYWTSLAEQIRKVRNDAGHPESIDPVSPESVHASLLIFPELAKLIADLDGWINAFYK
jgi:hypothetical protein